MHFSGFSKTKRWSWVGLGVGAIALTSATSFYVLSQANLTAKPDTPPETPTVKRIAALGRIEPAAEVIRLAVPVALDGDRVAELKVKQGDRVQAGQLIAVLDSRDRLQDAVQQAQEQVRVAEAKLAQIQAGAKSGEVQAQQATIARLQAQQTGELAAQKADIDRWEAEVRTAQTELKRFDQLRQEGAISASNFDSKRLAFETAQAQLNQAKAKQAGLVGAIDAQIQEARATLDRIAEVRPIDVQAAKTEVSTAIAQVKRAQTELEQAFVRAPSSGQILKIHTRVGEKVTDSGIADLAQTDQMVAIAEVYQSDIGNVKVGQAAVITSQVFTDALPGSVSEVGLQINKQNVFSNQPGENLDRRIVEVKIRLSPQASKQVSSLTNLQVQTTIMLN